MGALPFDPGEEAGRPALERWLSPFGLRWEGGYAAGESYFPEALKDRQYYFPVERGLEQKIAEKLRYLRERDKTSTIRRYE